MNLIFHPESFLVGLWLADHHDSIREWVMKRRALLAGLILIPGTIVIGLWGWNAMSLAAMIWLLPGLALYFGTWLVVFETKSKPWRGQKVIGFISDRTYSIYLIHVFTNYLARPYLKELAPLTAWVLGLGLAFAGGALFFEIAERPFLNLRQRLRNEQPVQDL
jgi:peptidoglycan/LPS O-acetylase OafA/YrhL